MQRHADDQSPDDLDHGDEDADPHVARDELRGAVHGPVEIRLALQLVLPPGRLLLGEEPRVVLRLDGHLLARQGVQGEARGHLGDARGALRDDDELHRDDDDEDDDPDHVAFDALGADHERGEGPHDVAVEVVALGQDQARGGDVQRQAEDRGDQQQGREDGELQRVPGVQDREDDEQREHEVHGHEDVQEHGGHRDEEHHDHHDHADGDKDVASLGPEVSDDRAGISHGISPSAAALIRWPPLLSRSACRPRRG